MIQNQIIRPRIMSAALLQTKRRSRHWQRRDSQKSNTHRRKGDDFERLPETFVIFITENDVMREGNPIYWVERCFLKSGQQFGDGSHIIYVNGAYRDQTPIGKLMHDFACTDPADMYYETLADRVRYFKESKEGVTLMCRVLEDMRYESWQEGVREGKKETSLSLAEMGLPIEKIAQAVKISVDVVQKWIDEGVYAIR